jgi:hypothetical protein
MVEYACEGCGVRAFLCEFIPDPKEVRKALDAERNDNETSS